MSQAPLGYPKRGGNSFVGRQEALTRSPNPTRRYIHNPLIWMWTSVWERWSFSVGRSRAWPGPHSPVRRPPCLAVLSHFLPFPVSSEAATLALGGEGRSCSKLSFSLPVVQCPSQGLITFPSLPEGWNTEQEPNQHHQNPRVR